MWIMMRKLFFLLVRSTRKEEVETSLGTEVWAMRKCENDQLCRLLILKQFSVRSEFWKTEQSKELTPPFVPSFDNYCLDDAQYFDREFTKRASCDSPAVVTTANLGIKSESCHYALFENLL